MRLTTQDMNRYFYEYAFWDVINEHNQDAIGNDDKANIIHTTQARGLREKLVNELRKQNIDLDHASINQFKQAVNTVFDNANYGSAYSDDNQTISQQRQAFVEMTGLADGKQMNGYTEIAGRDSYLPISPYDTRFSHLGAVLANGSKLGAISANANVDASKLNMLNVARKTEFLRNLTATENGFSAFRSGDNLFDKDDVSGLSRLRLWMTSDEYDNVRDYVNSTIDMDHITSKDLTSYRRMTDKAVYILRGLKDEGYNYTIEKDGRLGQIKARVENTKLDIRITDTPNNSDYIGRIYDNGITGTYNATRKDVATGQYKINATPSQALDLVNFALGRRVFVRDAQNKPSKIPVGRDMITKRMISGKMTPYHTAYHPNGNFTAVSGPYMIDGKPDSYHNAVRMIFNTRDRHRTTTYMADSDAAQEYLRSSVESARNNFADRIGVEDLIKAHQEHSDDPNYVPEFDNDPLVSDIQQAVWDELTTPEEDGKKNIMLKPGVTQEDLNDFLSSNPDGVDPDELDKYQYDLNLSNADMARRFVLDNEDYYVGQFDLDDNGKRFDPANVSKFQTSQYGMYRNNEDMIKALRLANISADELKGNSDNLQNIASNLIKYDPESAKDMSQLKSPFMQSMYLAIRQSLADNGLTVQDGDIKIDKNGIVQYKGTMFNNERQISRDGKVNEAKTVTGQIGQIFEPKQDGLDQGVVYTDFAGGNNYAFIPGYTAQILPQAQGEDKTLEERTVLTGYKQQLIKNIKYQLRQDLLLSTMQTEAGSPTGINNTYRQIYGERKDMDFVDQYQEQGMPDHVLRAMIASESQKVRYPNEIRDGSTVNAEYRADAYGVDIANDNSLDPYNVTGNRNMSVLTKESDGYFDPIASNATTTNQGIAKFLASGAEVDDDGKIIPGPKEGPGSRTSLMNIPEAQFMGFNPFDRQNMTISNWLQAERVTPDVNVAQMTFGGWNQDDGVVISKEFAENYELRDSTGKMRSLKVGDKISDMNGNKGVINLIVDPDMPRDEAEKQGLTKEVAWFKNNPKMDIVMAPFPAVSRYNGGTARQLMREPEDLVDLDGNTVKAAMGKMPMIITDKAADVKTRIYSEDDIREGKGRKVSAQLAWSLAAKDADNILHEAYGQNGSSLSNLTEYMNVMGLDMDPYGNMKEHLDQNTVANRNVIKQPDIVYTAKGRVDYKSTTKDLAKQLNNQGGMMELPFEIKLANGDKTKTVPVMSSYLRSGQEMQDGTLVVHDYTHQYENMYQDGIRYRDAQKKIGELSQLPSLSSSDQRKLERAQKTVTDTQKKAQEAYDSVARSVKNRVFEGKHNIFRDKIMAHRMPKSATSIWTADPRLDIDTIKMGTGMAEQLGIKNGDSTLIWRDPILRDGGLRYMKVEIDPRLTGVSINPSMDKSFDGDFDGDTVGIVALQTRAAKKEAKEKFGVKNNLLDYGNKNPDGTYPLYMQHSLDIKVETHKHPELEKRWDKITKDVNDFEKQYAEGKINKAQVDIARTNAVNTINKYFKDCYKDVGEAHIKYDGVTDHLKSVKEACLDTGAKGSMDKFKDYAKWLGVDMTTNKDTVEWDTIKDHGKTLSTRQMQQETMKATAIKSFGTGVAGAYSQRGIRALRNLCPKAVTELTYPVTQAVLQIKHDPAMAKKIYGMMMGPVRNMWRGYDMDKTVDKDGNATWKVNYEDGKPVKASKDKWIKTFYKMYTEDMGVNPNANYIKEVAGHMAGKDGKMESIEDLSSMSLMDKLAYGGSFQDVMDAAKNHENLYKGKYNSQFAPNKLRDNVELAHKQMAKAKEVQANLSQGKAVTFGPDDHTQAKTFTKSDTLAGNSKKQHVKTHVVQETVSEPETQDAADETMSAKENSQASQPAETGTLTPNDLPHVDAPEKDSDTTLQMSH